MPNTRIRSDGFITDSSIIGSAPVRVAEFSQCKHYDTKLIQISEKKL